MSTSDLFILNGKSTTHLAEFQNGYGSGPRCWSHLSQKYLNQDFDFYASRSTWSLGKDERLEDYERVSLLMTFDRSFIPISEIGNAARACQRFGKDCENGRSVNHWPDFGDTLHELSKMKFNRHARGIVLQCTSVSDVWSRPSDDWLQNAWSIFKNKENSEV